MSKLFRILLLALLLVLTGLFNVGLIEVRVDEIRYHVGKIAVDEHAAKTFGIVAKYELIKRRMLHGEEDVENYEMEARVAALTSSDESEEERRRKKSRAVYHAPVRGMLNLIRFAVGKEKVNPVEENRVLKALEIGYFWERNRKYPEAISIYDTVLSMPAVDAEIKAAVLAHKAFCHSMMSEYDVSKDIYERVITIYPNTQAGILAWKLLDFLESMEKERERVRKETLSDFERAKQFYLLMDYRNAIRHFSIFLQEKGFSRLAMEARFFKGRSHEELGEVQEATTEYGYIIRKDKSRRWARQANRRMIMIGEFYEHKQQMAEEARRQLAAYKDEGFMNHIDQLTELVGESSLRKELMAQGGAGRAQNRVGSEEVLSLINEIGSLDLTGEEARAKQEKIEQMKQELFDKGKLSRTEMKELKRMQALKENAYRRPTAIKSVIDENASQLKYLYNKRLRRGAKISGKMQVSIRIMPDGSVGGTKVVQSNLGDNTFENQVVERIENWRFRQVPDSLGELTVNYPFEFYEEE